MPGEGRTGIEKGAGERVGSASVDAPALGARTLRAGGEFLKALAGDLAAVASRLRRSPIAKYRRTGTPRAPAPARVPPPPTIGRVLWRFSLVLFAFATICAGALSAVALWVLFGFPPEPRGGGADTLGSQFEARKGESPGGVGPLNVTGGSRQELGHAAGAQGGPAAAAAVPTIASSGASPPAAIGDRAAASDQRSFPGSGSSTAAAAEPAKAAKESQAGPEAGADRPQLARTEPQARRAPARQQEISGTLTELRARTQCNASACAARYNSFHAADCTYQPYGGGPRQICELSTRSAEAAPQTSHAATDPRSEAQDKRVAERAAEVPKAAVPARAGAQCNVDLCAAAYASFHAADCTYQPYDGGPRRVCER
jgi:hypothetical protein